MGKEIPFKANGKGPIVQKDLEISPDWMEKSAWKGRKNIIMTIMMGKMEMVLPAIHIISKFIGSCRTGPNAISHERFATRLGARSRTAPEGRARSSTKPGGAHRSDAEDITMLRSERLLECPR